jgi:hypothetical protein
MGNHAGLPLLRDRASGQKRPGSPAIPPSWPPFSPKGSFPPRITEEFLFQLGLAFVIIGEVHTDPFFLETGAVRNLFEGLPESFRDGFRKSLGSDEEHGVGRKILTSDLLEGGDFRIVLVPFVGVVNREFPERSLFHIADMRARPGGKVDVLAQQGGAGFGARFDEIPGSNAFSV